MIAFLVILLFSFLLLLGDDQRRSAP